MQVWILIEEMCFIENYYITLVKIWMLPIQTHSKWHKNSCFVCLWINCINACTIAYKKCFTIKITSLTTWNTAIHSGHSIPIKLLSLGQKPTSQKQWRVLDWMFHCRNYQLNEENAIWNQTMLRTRHLRQLFRWNNNFSDKWFANRFDFADWFSLGIFFFNKTVRKVLCACVQFS